jgi:hypothetical protein
MTFDPDQQRTASLIVRNRVIDGSYGAGAPAAGSTAGPVD